MPFSAQDRRIAQDFEQAVFGLFPFAGSGAHVRRVTRIGSSPTHLA